MTAILENNLEISLTFLVNEESKQLYKIRTRNLKEEYILYFKHVSCRQRKGQLYNSWVFNYTEDDKEGEVSQRKWTDFFNICHV